MSFSWYIFFSLSLSSIPELRTRTGAGVLKLNVLYFVWHVHGSFTVTLSSDSFDWGIGWRKWDAALTIKWYSSWWCTALWITYSCEYVMSWPIVMRTHTLCSAKLYFHINSIRERLPVNTQWNSHFTPFSCSILHRFFSPRSGVVVCIPCCLCAKRVHVNGKLCCCDTFSEHSWLNSLFSSNKNRNNIV